MASRANDRKACMTAEGAVLAEAIKEEIAALQHAQYQVKDILKTVHVSRASFYRYKDLTHRPTIRYLWSLYRAARAAEQARGGTEEFPGVRRFSDLALLLFSWRCAGPRAELVRDLRKEQKDLEKESSAAHPGGREDQFAELEEAIEALAPAGVPMAGNGPAGRDLEAGSGGWEERGESELAAGLPGGSAELVAPVPGAEGDRRNDQYPSPASLPTDEEQADIDAAAGYWHAGRLSDALIATRAIAADHSAESLLAFVDTCKDAEADSLLESFLSEVAGNAAADAARTVRTVRLFLDAGYRHEALAIEVETAAGSR
ncbi:hypothetical protein ACFQZ2_01270 [Streptomonospora algeriensis]|uniref:Uncharacterized protein n=1 Tax=Streptomonospora algeriensis TaxID=995084 RepID=A0ABW3BD51_9ACTN